MPESEIPSTADSGISDLVQHLQKGIESVRLFCKYIVDGTSEQFTVRGLLLVPQPFVVDYSLFPGIRDNEQLMFRADQVTQLRLRLLSQVQRFIQKNFFSSLPTEGLTRSAVEKQSNAASVFLSHIGKGCALGEELTNQSVTVFICSSLPGCVRISKINLAPKPGGKLPVHGKLFSMIAEEADRFSVPDRWYRY